MLVFVSNLLRGQSVSGPEQYWHRSSQSIAVDIASGVTGLFAASALIRDVPDGGVMAVMWSFGFWLGCNRPSSDAWMRPAAPLMHVPLLNTVVGAEWAN